MKNLLILWDPPGNKNHLHSHFWIYVFTVQIYSIDKDEHVLKTIVNTSCIILYLNIVSIYDTDLVNRHGSLVIKKWNKNVD